MKKTVKTVQVFWEEASRIIVRRKQTVASYGNGPADAASPHDAEDVKDIEPAALNTEGESNEK